MAVYTPRAGIGIDVTTTTTTWGMVIAALADGRSGDAVTALVACDGNVTPEQVKDLLEPYMPVHGDRYLSIREHVSAFHGTSSELVELVEELIAQGRVVLARGPLGGNVQPVGVPIVDRWPPNGYREHHWAPVVLQPGS